MHEQVFSLWKNGTLQSFWCKLSFLEPCKGNLEAVWDGLCSGIDNLIVWSSADGGAPAQTQIRLGRTLYASPRGNITPTENRGEHRSPDQRSHPASNLDRYTSDHALLLPSSHALPHDLRSFRGFPDGNLVPKHDAFQMTKPERPKHSSPVGCDPAIRPSRNRAAWLFHPPASPSVCPPQTSIRFHRTRSVNNGDG